MSKVKGIAKYDDLWRSGERVRVAVLVSGGGTNLEAILHEQLWGKIACGKVELVVSNKADAYALERAKKYEVKAVTIDKDKEGQEGFERKLRELLEAEDIGLIVLAGFLSILSEDFVKEWPKRIINVHPSLIPSFCGEGYYGIHVHEAALAKGVKVSGATVHFVNEIPDGGEIISQWPVFVESGDTPKTLQKRIMERAEQKLLPQAVEEVCKGILEEAGFGEPPRR